MKGGSRVGRPFSWPLTGEPAGALIRLREGRTMGEENERFDAVLVRILWWDHKISVIKLVRETTGLGVAEAKHFIENLPRTLKEDVSSEEGDALRQRFYDLGAILELRPSSRAGPG